MSPRQSAFIVASVILSCLGVAHLAFAQGRASAQSGSVVAGTPPTAVMKVVPVAAKVGSYPPGTTIVGNELVAVAWATERDQPGAAVAASPVASGMSTWFGRPVLTVFATFRANVA
ncbi:MAG: hypothetical protein V1790_09430, partial [Planctomycetota bacterium]